MDQSALAPEVAALPAPPAHQPPLFSLEMVELREVEGRNGRWSATALKQAHRQTYDAIAELLGRGWGHLELARVFKVHHLTVAAVAEAEPEIVKKARQRQIDRIATAGHLLVEKILEHPDLVPWNVKGLVAKQLLELAEVMAGRVSGRIEHVDRVDIHSGWAEFVEKVLQPGEDVREIGFEPGKICSLEDGAHLGDRLGADGPDRDDAIELESPAERAKRRHRDQLSEGIEAAAEETPGGDTDSAADSGSEPRPAGAAEPRAGGGPNDTAGAKATIHPDA